MIKRRDLERYKSREKWELGFLEKDILQHIVLHGMEKMIDRLVFKGGTALQKAYSLPRFSEDLDFTQKREIEPSDLSGTVLSHLKYYGYPAEWKTLEESERTLSGRLLIEGPLFTGKKHSLCSLRIEISRREEVLFAPVIKEIIPRYTELPTYTINVMGLEEIAAEKIRAIMTRRKHRDLYDLHYLIRRDASIEIDLVEKKLDYNKIGFDLDKFKDRVFLNRERWEIGLSRIVRTVPDFDEVSDTIIGKVRDAV